MAMRLETINVLMIERELLTGMDFWEDDDEKRACMKLAYLEGVREMADATIKAIRELGGN